MALFEGAEHFDRAALAFNAMMWNSVISITRENLPMFYVMLGRMEDATVMGDGRLVMQHMELIAGDKMEVQYTGKLRHLNVLPDTASEVSRHTPTLQSDGIASCEFDLTHFNLKEPIPESLMRRVSGSAQKTQSYLEVINGVLAESVATDFADFVHAENPASHGTGGRTQDKNGFGSLAWIIDDATDYLLDRSDAANARFRSYVRTSTGALDLNKIGLAQNTIGQFGQRPNLALADVENFTAVQQLLQAKIQLRADPFMDRMGADYARYGNTFFVMDQRTGGNSGEVMYFLCTDDWKVVFDDSPMMKTTGAVVYDPTMEAGYVIPINIYAGIACSKPWRQGKLLGIS